MYASRLWNSHPWNTLRHEKSAEGRWVSLLGWVQLDLGEMLVPDLPRFRRSAEPRASSAGCAQIFCQDLAASRNLGYWWMLRMLTLASPQTADKWLILRPHATSLSPTKKACPSRIGGCWMHFFVEETSLNIELRFQLKLEWWGRIKTN